MNIEGNHPAEEYAADVRTAESRGTITVVALALTVLERVVAIPVATWQSGLIRDAQRGEMPPQSTLELSDTLMATLGIGQFVLLVVTGVLFLRWLHRVVFVTRGLGAEMLTWAPKDAVLAFIIPIISIVRPYQVMRDVHDMLAPDAVPEPAPQVRAGDAQGYRQVEMVAPPAPAKLPHASISAWWAAFWFGNVLANIASRQTGTSADDLLTRNTLNSASDAVEIVSATLAIVVVRAVTARLVERYRRVRHNPVEALAAAHLSVQPRVET